MSGSTRAGQEPVITVRYFAAAKAAVGRPDALLGLPSGATVGDVVDASVRLAHESGSPGSGDVVRVLERCSFLVDGVSVTDRRHPLDGASVLDVLPPFAGG